MKKEKKEIRCKDVEDFLQPYLEDKLDNSDTKLLIGHLKSCPECMDELEIRYLLYEGLKLLESGQDFNLKAELEERLYRSEEHLLMMERLKTSAVLLIVALGIFGAVQIILMMVG